MGKATDKKVPEVDLDEMADLAIQSLKENFADPGPIDEKRTQGPAPYGTPAIESWDLNDDLTEK